MKRKEKKYLWDKAGGQFRLKRNKRHLSITVYTALRETSGLLKIQIMFILSPLDGKSDKWFHNTLFCMPIPQWFNSILLLTKKGWLSTQLSPHLDFPELRWNKHLSPLYFWLYRLIARYETAHCRSGGPEPKHCCFITWPPSNSKRTTILLNVLHNIDDKNSEDIWEYLGLCASGCRAS